jgi:hypothetical protein
MRLEINFETSREILPLKIPRKTRAALHYSQGIRGTQATNLKKGRKHGGFFRVARENTDSKRVFHRSLRGAGFKKRIGGLCYARELSDKSRRKRDECGELE